MVPFLACSFEGIIVDSLEAKDAISRYLIHISLSSKFTLVFIYILYISSLIVTIALCFTGKMNKYHWCYNCLSVY